MSIATKSLQDMTRDEFLAVFQAQKREATGAPAVGAKYTLLATGETVTVARVEPGAKSCCFFICDNGRIVYRNFTPAKRQVEAIIDSEDRELASLA